MPMRWRCAACGARRESGDYWCGSRLMKLILIVSHFFGSWSIKTRITQRTHAQLYGTMCGILDSIHQVRAPLPQSAELEVPLEAAVRNRGRLGGQQGVVRGSARIILVPHVTTVARQAHLDFPARGFKDGMFALLFSPNLFWVCLAGYGLVSDRLETFVLHAYSH